jgi:hypothetical protein
MPPRSSEILDSEDEDDLVVAAPTLVATRTSGEDAPIDMNADHSTASTEELLRQAQLNLMAPTQEDAPVVNFSDLAATSVDTSPSSTHKKRPLDDTHPQPRSSGKLKRIKIVTKPEPHYHPTDFPSAPPIPPFDGTNDTIPGPTLPSADGFHGVDENKTPRPRQPKSSQQQPSSADQMNSLTPWSGTALGSSDNITSEDAVGLPKEMYVPRPSRSRSAMVDTSNINYSMVVEKDVKKTKQRRSITDSADHSTSTPIFPQHPIDQAPEFERLSPTPEASLPKNSTHLASTVPESIQALSSSTKSSKSSKKAAVTKQPAKRGRPKKKVIEDEEDELAHEVDTVAANPKTPASASKTEVQVVIEARPPVEARPNPELAASVYQQLKQHKSRESTPKTLQDQQLKENTPVPSQMSKGDVKAEPELEVDDESEEEIVIPRSTARTKANAKAKAKAKSPEPAYKEDDDSEHEVYDEYAEEVVKPKAKSKAKPKAKLKAKGKAAKAVVVPDPPSDHEEEVPEPPLAADDGESEVDHISEAEEDSEDESPKPKSKAKAKAKPEPKSKSKTKTKAATPIPAAATPKPSPPVHEAETPVSAPVEEAIPAAVVTPKVTTAKKDAKSSAKPSWQQSTYRVGLSKTQRIPSLLKVFKK